MAASSSKDEIPNIGNLSLSTPAPMGTENQRGPPKLSQSDSRVHEYLLNRSKDYQSVVKAREEVRSHQPDPMSTHTRAHSVKGVEDPGGRCILPNEEGQEYGR